MHPGGRPLKFTSVDEMIPLINEYFHLCDINDTVYTISGLCLHLGIVRETLCEYEKKPEFSDTIKSAKFRVENYIEVNSLRGRLNPTVSIFNLKNNFGWADKTESQLKIDANVTSRLQTMSDAELETLRSSLHNQLIDSVSS